MESLPLIVCGADCELFASRGSTSYVKVKQGYREESV